MTAVPPSDVWDRFSRMARYWLRLKGDARLPAYSDFDPIEVPWALATMFVLERQQGRFQYRLAGSEIEARYGISLKGKTVHDIMNPKSAVSIENRWAKAMDGPEICIAHTSHLSATGAPITSWRLTLPYGADRTHAETLISLVAYHSLRDIDESPMVSTETEFEDWIPVDNLMLGVAQKLFQSI